MTGLNVWHGEKLLGTLDSHRGALRFTYASASLASGLGRPVVSASLPTRSRPFSAAQCRPFFDGLLPEGESRRVIAYDLGLVESDTYGLLTALGRDCAGALSIVPFDQPGPSQIAIHRAKPLDEAELAAKVRNLRSFPLGVDGEVRVSLGGVQEKLLLTRTVPGGWALPVEGSASTHILKPERADMPGHVVSEALCLRLASALGLSAAKVALTTIAGRRVIVVERFDRVIDDKGEITRAHQENGCQALGIRVSSVPLKYEDSGGPSLRQLAGILTRWGSSAERDTLLAQTVLNVLVGNADGHGMNTSFILPGDGMVWLSPIYDVFSSLSYDVSTTLGMFINEVRDIRAVTRQDLVAEGTRWGMARPAAERLVDALLAEAPRALAVAASQTPEASGEMIDFLTERVSSLA